VRILVVPLHEAGASLNPAIILTVVDDTHRILQRMHDYFSRGTPDYDEAW
jgi:hypothetical protein